MKEPNPFAGHVFHEYGINILHQIGHAVVAQIIPNPEDVESPTATRSFFSYGSKPQWYIARYKNCIGHGYTALEAIRSVKETYKEWLASETELINFYSFLDSRWSVSDYFSFKEYNGLTRKIDFTIGLTREELRRIVNDPERATFNYEHYYLGLTRLGIRPGSSYPVEK